MLDILGFGLFSRSAPPDLAPRAEKRRITESLQHDQHAMLWQQKTKKRDVCPVSVRSLTDRQRGEKVQHRKESPQKSPQGDVFPWPLCQHITLLYRMLPTPQLFRKPNKRAFKLFFSFSLAFERAFVCSVKCHGECTPRSRTEPVMSYRPCVVLLHKRHDITSQCMDFSV